MSDFRQIIAKKIIIPYNIKGLKEKTKKLMVMASREEKKKYDFF